MAPWAILYIYRARLHARLVLVQELLAILGIAVGVALLFASQVASTSLDGSIRQLSDGIVGRASLQLLARDPHGFDQRLLGRVQGLPGVSGVEPVLEARATVTGPHGQRTVELIASNPRYANLGGALLQSFTATQLGTLRVLALPAPVAEAIGVDSLQMVGLEIGARRLTALMGAKLDAGDIGALVRSPVAIAPLAYAQEATGLRGRITRILVRARAGRQREVRTELEALAAGRSLDVEPTDIDARLFAAAAAPANQSEELFAAISALVGFMFAFNAMLVTAHLRRGLVETLRRRGATRTMTVQVLLFDAFVLGVLGTLLGLALGEVLSMLVFRVDPGYLAFAFAVGEQRIVAWQSIALAAGAGLLAACIGVLAPMRGLLTPRLRSSPGSELDPRGRVRPRKRAATDVAPRAGDRLPGAHHRDPARAAAGGDPRQRHARGGTAVAAAARLRCAARRLRGAAASAVCGVNPDRRRRAAHPHNRMRSLAIAATGAIAVFGSVAVEGARSNLQRGLDASAREIDSNAAVWVSRRAPPTRSRRFPSDRGRRCARSPAHRVSAPSGSTVAASWTGAGGGCGCSHRRAPLPLRYRPASSCGGELAPPARRSARAGGRCSRRRSPPRTTCGSASPSRCPRRTPPLSG